MPSLVKAIFVLLDAVWIVLGSLMLFAPKRYAGLLAGFLRRGRMPRATIEQGGFRIRGLGLGLVAFAIAFSYVVFGTP
jgi:hypothetical protein